MPLYVCVLFYFWVYDRSSSYCLPHCCCHSDADTEMLSVMFPNWCWCRCLRRQQCCSHSFHACLSNPSCIDKVACCSSLGCWFFCVVCVCICFWFVFRKRGQGLGVNRQQVFLFSTFTSAWNIVAPIRQLLPHSESDTKCSTFWPRKNV